MGHPGLEPEVVLTIQPAVPYPSRKEKYFARRKSVQARKESTKYADSFHANARCCPARKIKSPDPFLAIIVILVQWEIPQTADG